MNFTATVDFIEYWLQSRTFMKHRLPFILLLGLSSCIPFQSVFLGHPDQKDAKRFKSETISSDTPCFEFNTVEAGQKIMVNNWTNDLPEFQSMESLCGEHKVRSLLVIKNDSILFSYQKSGYESNAMHSSYSMSKSIVSCLIGMAIDDGFIKSEHVLVNEFIPELDTNSSNIKLSHLLNHTSGIQKSLAMDARIYYGNDILNELDKIRFECAPGIKQRYENMNTQLLALVLSRAVGQSLSKYTEQKLWKQIGMCHEGSWSTDKKGVEKAFCCISATSLDYAKLGRLYLNKGLWGDKRILSEEWYNKSIRRDTLEGSSFNFNYSWHIGLEKYGDFMAIGLYKQHIYVYPEKKTIIVLLNDRENKLLAERVNWWNIFRQISDQI